MWSAASKLSILKAKVCQEIPSPLLRVCAHADFLLDGKAASELKTHPGLGADPQLDAS